MSSPIPTGRAAAPPKPANLVPPPIPPELMKDLGDKMPLFRAWLHELYRWLGQNGRYLDKVGQYVQDSLTNDFARDESVDAAFVDISANSDVILGAAAFEPSGVVPPNPAEAQAVLAVQAFSPQESPDVPDDAQSLLAAEVFLR